MALTGRSVSIERVEPGLPVARQAATSAPVHQGTSASRPTVLTGVAPPSASECGPGPSAFADRVLLTISTPKSINQSRRKKYNSFDVPGLLSFLLLGYAVYTFYSTQ